MIYVKIENGVVVQKQPYAEDGFIEAADHILPGYTHDGSDFSEPVKTDEELIGKIKILIDGERKKRLEDGITVNSTYRYGIEHKDFLMDQVTLLNAGDPTTFGSYLWDSDNVQHTVTDAQMKDVFKAGSDYAAKVYKEARTAKDNLTSLTTQQLIDYDLNTEITWPSNAYTI